MPSTFRQTRSSCRRAISDGTPCRMMSNAGWRTSRVDTPVTWRWRRNISETGGGCQQ
ncbi:hypothetical protein HMPREF3196_00817 [Bifidobacterium bifidum]|uniref:Uncharacterized protein n=1 Tax=Bifidobacterium bifidum TaxID=1681 RepID=A0A133KQN3_BIFBI|nr:hypothetical protein HMPREF3196_00817 [Bifidobacterium bifidum]